MCNVLAAARKCLTAQSAFIKCCEGYFWHFDSQYLTTAANLPSRHHIRKNWSISPFLLFLQSDIRTFLEFLFLHPALAGLPFPAVTSVGPTALGSISALATKQELKWIQDHLRPIIPPPLSPEWGPFTTVHRCKTNRKPIFVKLSLPSLFLLSLFFFGGTDSHSVLTQRQHCWSRYRVSIKLLPVIICLNI